MTSVFDGLTMTEIDEVMMRFVDSFFSPEYENVQRTTVMKYICKEKEEEEEEEEKEEEEEEEEEEENDDVHDIDEVYDVDMVDEKEKEDDTVEKIEKNNDINVIVVAKLLKAFRTRGRTRNMKALIATSNLALSSSNLSAYITCEGEKFIILLKFNVWQEHHIRSQKYIRKNKRLIKTMLSFYHWLTKEVLIDDDVNRFKLKKTLVTMVDRIKADKYYPTLRKKLVSRHYKQQKRVSVTTTNNEGYIIKRSLKVHRVLKTCMYLWRFDTPDSENTLVKLNFANAYIKESGLSNSYPPTGLYMRYPTKKVIEKLYAGRLNEELSIVSKSFPSDIINIIVGFASL
jgi:hypothetical protein